MRRVVRIVRNAATVLSLVLCIATVVLWVRSYFREDLIDMGGGAADFDAGMRTAEGGRVFDIANGAILTRRSAWLDPTTGQLLTIEVRGIARRFIFPPLAPALIPV